MLLKRMNIRMLQHLFMPYFMTATICTHYILRAGNIINSLQGFSGLAWSLTCSGDGRQGLEPLQN